MGHSTVASLKSLKAGKLFNDLCGFNKKNKLGLANPTMEDIAKWVEEH
jgi:lysyl-tRNA synthetase class 2